MADTTFTNNVTLTDADWFNDLNRLHYTIFGDPANASAARTNLGLGALATLSTTITLGTPQNTTSGTTVPFNSIPSGVKRITVNFDGVSTSGSSAPIIQLGDSGGIEATGYLGSVSGGGNGSSLVAANYTTGVGLSASHSSAAILHGSVVFTLLNSSTNTWAAFGVIGQSNVTNTWMISSTKSLSATLDRLLITTAGGSDTFDAGSINIVYE